MVFKGKGGDGGSHIFLNDFHLSISYVCFILKSVLRAGADPSWLEREAACTLDSSAGDHRVYDF